MLLRQFQASFDNIHFMLRRADTLVGLAVVLAGDGMTGQGLSFHGAIIGDCGGAGLSKD
jgi:hypothetical protein